MASAMDTAVEAALLRPHFLISAPPRVATVLVNVVCSHSSSPMTSRAGSPPIRAFRKSGTCAENQRGPCFDMRFAAE